MAWKAIGHPTVRKQRDKWVVRVDGIDTVTGQQQIDGGVRSVFSPSVPIIDLMRLVAAEQDCCQFFRFAITVDTRGVALEVRAPEDALSIVESMFGSPS